MKRRLVNYLFCCLLLIGFGLSVRANENQPRLAILSGSEFSQAGDLLAVELSGQTNVVLLERNEIDKILKEQKLAQSGISIKESIDVGHILGADGLLTLGLVQSGTNSHLAATLIAVKQGVILDVMESPWPMKDSGEWAKLVRAHFQPFLPKLGVLTKDALPISVLNLRSAASSPESKQFEHQLTELLLNRLTHEKELFVLERRKLDKLTTEKEFSKTEDSPFWNGSYLLEGIVDKNGYSKEEATISARLVPPGGGTPVEIEISGKRNQPEQMIEQLARQIMASLKKQSSAPEWKPAAEAIQFYEEAKWALKWQVNKEAQAAAEAAWALGKRDLDCAMVRIQAHLTDALPDPHFVESSLSETTATDEEARSTLDDDKRTYHPAAMIWERGGLDGKFVRILMVLNQPDQEKLAGAIHVLGLYREFSQSLPAEEPKMDSDWYRLGVSTLTGASKVLQHFYLVPEAQKGVEDKLAELRRLAREVSDYILKSPSVRDAYWVGNQFATHDTLGRFSEAPNIFQCKLHWGPFWQEKPEDTIALYRGLMSSEVFCYIHKDLWFRELASPLLPAWNQQDKERGRLLWSQFRQELDSSTNLFLKLEASSLQVAQAANEKELANSFNSLISLLFDNHDAIVTNNVELLYLNWRLGDLVGRNGLDHSSAVKEKLEQQLYHEYWAKLEAMDSEYWNNLRLRKQQQENDVLFEKQKEILKGNSYEFFAFNRAFSFYQYSPAQAAELEPLCASYKSNLLARASSLTGVEMSKLQGGISQVTIVEGRLARILHPSSQTVKSANTNVIVVRPVELKAPEMSAQALLVDKFFAIPEKLLPGETPSNIKVFSHRVREGKLLLDLRYDETAHNSSPISDRAAIAILDPKNGAWQIIPYPPSDDPYARPTGFNGAKDESFYFELFKSAVYLSAVGVMRYDLESRHWEKVEIPEPKLCQLYAIGDHLYAANDESIFEILDRGHGTRMLASNRRRPAVTALDSLSSLNSPLLFPGPDQTVRTCIGNKLYTWNGKDWEESMNLAVTRRPEVFEEGTLLRSNPVRGEAQVWFLAHTGTNANLYWEEQVFELYGGGIPSTGMFNNKLATNNSKPKPIWKPNSPMQTAGAPGIATLTNVHFFQEDCAVTNTAKEWSAAEKNGHHAFLVCLESGMPKPLFVPLKFDVARGPVPSASLGSQKGFWGLGSPWLAHAADGLMIGYPGTPGVWLIPDAQLQAAINHERELTLQQEAEEVARIKRLQQELLSQYDLNHDGNLNPEEKEAAVKDLRWLEVNWPAIDTNKNGFLDEEDNLALFDANENGQVDDSELQAMDKVQTLVAAELLRRWDQDRDGALSEQELRTVVMEENQLHATARTYFNMMAWLNYDKDHDRRLNQQELESLLISLTRRAIVNAQPRPRGFMPTPLYNWSDPATLEKYKGIIEYLWQKQRGQTEKIAKP
ncbi:CsgG/HfaB family protein [Pedosphaera parvula]|uniref:Calcium-binding EF-hand-containing protein n=1 Tax=Pedosphaera parvula (strain Ellin514) TaxID=320771 RepID=B9XQI4_PEDPL|nr:CsgG/HfaB family protein [Pedosphaera parvula]EEF57909.1 Calcium-binding EF-hand-containing protein [Pedosphaera parvula Ellin514]